jgi:transcriptional regulator with XRE-family HTH domain
VSEPTPPTTPTRRGRNPPLRSLPYLRAWRERRHFSQHELATLADVGIATMKRVESGHSRATWDTVTRLARALKVSPKRLMQAPPETTAQEEKHGDADPAGA